MEAGQEVAVWLDEPQISPVRRSMSDQLKNSRSAGAFTAAFRNGSTSRVGLGFGEAEFRVTVSPSPGSANAGSTAACGPDGRARDSANGDPGTKSSTAPNRSATPATAVTRHASTGRPGARRRRPGPDGAAP